MAKHTPYEKLSKKDKREADALRRGTWTMNPVTRRAKNPKAYDRKKSRSVYDRYGSGNFCVLGAGAR